MNNVRQKIKWIFFDIGGVLRDETTYNIWRKDTLLLKAKEINPELSEEDFENAHKQASKMRGSLRQNILEILIGNKKKALEIRNKTDQETVQTLKNADLMPNALDAVKKLSQNYSLGIISNYSSDIKDWLKEMGLINYFKILGISQDYNLSKPNPEFFKAVLKDAKAKPEESAMIDDNIERGLDVAKQLGMTTVFFNTENRTDIPPKIIDHTIYSLIDLLNVF